MVLLRTLVPVGVSFVWKQHPSHRVEKLASLIKLVLSVRYDKQHIAHILAFIMLLSPYISAGTSSWSGGRARCWHYSFCLLSAHHHIGSNTTPSLSLLTLVRCSHRQMHASFCFLFTFLTRKKSSIILRVEVAE